MLPKTNTSVAGVKCCLEFSFFWMLAFGAFAPLMYAQDKNPFAGDANAAVIGASQFRANCAFCHVLGARGGGRGPNGATQQGVGMTEAEIWQVITYIRSVQKKASATAEGNATHGRELFYGSGACANCHMILVKGGRLGPDLTGTGSAR